MSAGWTNTQICKIYDDGNINIEDICDLLAMEKDSVVLALMHGSKKYRKEHAKEEKVGSGEILMDVDGAKRGINSLIYCEDLNVRLKACKFVINEAAGRHDKSGFRDLNVNVNIVNDALIKAKAISAKLLEGEVIEV